jgi:hypothetical protein
MRHPRTETAFGTTSRRIELSLLGLGLALATGWAAGKRDHDFDGRCCGFSRTQGILKQNLLAERQSRSDLPHIS